MRAAEIIGTANYHEIHVLYKRMETVDHDCMSAFLVTHWQQHMHISYLS